MTPGAGSDAGAVVIVGASLAGLRAAEELRGQGFGGTVTVVGDEPHRPYDRPPLSKQVLAGDWPIERIVLTVMAEGGVDGLDLDWRLGARAVGLDTARRAVTLSSGEAIAYDGLVIATGATPRTLPGTTGTAGVHTLRTLDDCLAVRADLDAGAGRIILVGAGFIGSEVAATCRVRGCEVTILEALPVPLGRALGDEMGALMGELHRDHGVDLRLGTGVAGLEGGDRVERVRLADGSAVDADLVVVGIGVSPNTAWLEGSGLALDDGVVCDATTLAAPGVVAAGDVARWPSRRFGELMRIEHWDNAIAMGEHAARRLLVEVGATGDTPTDYDPVPWFWSDQYDRKVQLAGRSSDADEVRVVDGSTGERRFVALYRRGDRLAGVLAMNRPRPLVGYRNLVERGASWDEALAQAASELTMNGAAAVLLGVTLVSAAVDWVAVQHEHRPVEYVFKPLTLVALTASALALDPADPAVRGWFVVALVLSLAGDVFLMLPGDRFVPGLGSFLLAHLAYIVGLAVAGLDLPRVVAGLAVVVAAYGVVGTRVVAGVRSSEPALTGPVTAYMGVISAMVVCAIGTGDAVAIAGAGLFYVSDALIGWGRFVHSYGWGRLAVMVTYHLGQVLLVLSLL